MTGPPRVQHVVASGLVAALGAGIAYASFTQEPAGAFVFPRLISSVLAALAAWILAGALLGRAGAGGGVSGRAMRRAAPGLAVALAYVFWAAKALGFYTATTIAFFVLVSLYDPAPHARPGTWARRAAVTAGFMLAMYGLFAGLLNVFTPREVPFWTAQAAGLTQGRMS